RAWRAVTALAASREAAPATTYVSAVVGPEGFWCASVGDSRAYWLPDQGPGIVLTEDDTGAYGALSAWLGADADAPVPPVHHRRPASAGWLLLCTDGLSRYLPRPADVRAVVASRTGALDGARALVDHALAAGGADNVTALLMRVAPASTASGRS
ncbi:PP2C family serine/threonine-protein phosphatase, partial [Streptomyces sp. TRM64462]|uniref:PP2C family protein-serine/threonine phosphatase n=1 Tax=Streptomyces sp. TRM64462 TaxID=2741726 RepID=UPI0015868ECB